MAIAIGRLTNNALAPASTRTRRISSVAYADELMASELKIASAIFLDSRSLMSSWIDSGLPKRAWRTRWMARPVAVRGRDAASRATSMPGPA